MKADNPELPMEIMELQMGPSHPATHGTIKFNLKLEGEKVLDCDVEVGFLHRGFDKSCEQATWTQVIPYTDRLNYASSLINNVGYALAVEKLIGAETPPRCQYIRVIISELARIFDHLTCCGMAASELGAITVGFYMIEARELITRIIENLTGARLTVTYVRIGGLKHDLPPGFRRASRRSFHNDPQAARRLRPLAVAQPDLSRPYVQCRRDLARNRALDLQSHRPDPARHRGRLRRPQGVSLFGL